MKRKGRNHQDRWQPMADIFSALALIFMLLLILMLATWINDAYHEDGNDYTGWEHGATVDEEDSHHYDYPENEDDDGGGGGNQYTKPEETDPIDEEYGDKIAVRVIVVDAETNLIIEEPEIQFWLYDDVNSRQTLCTYYPLKTEYQTFETNEDGTFFLPEKLVHGEYTLRNISAPTGYVEGGSVTFTPDGSHDWHDPYIVYFPLEQIRSNFMIRVVDEYTGEPVPGGLFEVYATEDLIYADGTVFAHKGDTIDTLVPDKDGYAESDILSFRSHLAIRQVSAAEYYAVRKQDVSVPIYEVAESENAPVIEIPVAMTGITVTVEDELNGTKLSDIGLLFTNSDSSEFRNYTTDENGSISISMLQKNTDYILTQTVWKDMYQEATETYHFHVDELGYINESVLIHHTIENRMMNENTLIHHTIENRMIRLDLHCLNWVSHADLNGYTIRLIDNSGVCVAETSSGDGLLEGVEPGTYRVEITGKWNYILSSDEIEVVDTAELQSYHISILTVLGLVVLIILSAILLFLLIFGLIALVRHRKKKKQQKAIKEHETNGKET